MTHYRADIDGLRGVAVLGVVVFHLQRELLPGGYVGVDVFFVISGYLITSIALRERREGTFTLGRFFQRRVARIMPLSIIVSVSVLIAAACLYSTQDFASAGAVAAAAALFSANLKFITQGNYFEMSLDAQPLLHYWSLSLEEQFYFLFSFALLGLVRPAGSPSRLRQVTVAAFIASLGLCAVLTYLKPVWAFYLLPTRAWELLAGSLLAMRGGPPPEASRSPDGDPRRAWWGAGGVCAVACAYIFMGESSHFPGVVALLPVAAAASILRAGESPNWASRLLSTRALVAVGTVSYSLYLWHWPVFCFVDYRLFESGTWQRAIIKLAILVPLVVLSYFAFERPLRRVLGSPGSRFAGFTAVAAISCLLAIVGIAVRNHQHPDPRMASVAEGGIITGNLAQAGLVVALVGDSKATVLAKALGDWGSTSGARIHLASVSAQEFVPGSPLYDQSLRMLESTRPDVIIAAGAWTSRGIGGDPEIGGTMLADLERRCSSVIVIGDPPILPEPEYRQRIRSGDPLPIREADATRAKRRSANDVLRNACRQHAQFIDVDDLFQHPDGSLRLRLADGQIVFQDQHHLSGAAAKLVIGRVSPLLLQIQARRAGRK